MPKIKYYIVKTKTNLHLYLQRLIDLDLVAWAFSETRSGIFRYYIIAKHGTNKNKLRKILSEHIYK